MMKPILSIAVLVSNRRDTIRKCLDSLTPIREAIPCELIVLDTGCDEDVVAILREYADVLEKFTWCRDFSAARNETLKYAHGEWYLYLDDDEWFVDTTELIDFFQSGEYRDYGYASYIQRNYLDMQASQYTDAWVSRMTKLTPETHFESKIHEYMVPMNGNCRGIRSVVDHFGYVYETEEALWKHYERNAVLLQEMIEAEPENMRWRMQMAQEYRTVQLWDELEKLAEESLPFLADKDDMYSNIYRTCFCSAPIVAAKERGEYEKGIRLCETALADKRNTELFAAFCELRMTGFYYWLGNYEAVIQHGLSYLKWVDFFEENEPLLFLQRSAPFAADSFDVVMRKEVYSELICAGLRLGDASYLEKYLERLEWNKQHVYVFEDMIPTLVEVMNAEPAVETYGEVLRAIYGHGGLWEYFCGYLTEREESGVNVHPIMELIRAVLPEAVASADDDGAETVGSADDEGIMSEQNLGSGRGTATGHVELTPEMRDLVEQIKVQLRLLIANGMKDEARQILVQVRAMAPEDEELKDMEESI